ncbi:hypothetical protein RUM43_010290 [Polyplax serrata]|uniref:Uncharacterized protein n=1 Tax=Polyplax serrata TaxID=468196 RepID=A0AAN8S7Z1_POLSC
MPTPNYNHTQTRRTQQVLRHIENSDSSIKLKGSEITNSGSHVRGDAQSQNGTDKHFSTAGIRRYVSLQQMSEHRRESEISPAAND